MGKPSVYHAAIVLFLEFFAFGLLALPMLDVSINIFLSYCYAFYSAGVIVRYVTKVSL